MEQPKVLITGSSGFIGSHCITFFEKQGWNVSEWHHVEGLPEDTYDLVVHLAGYGNHHFQSDIHKIYAANVDLLQTLLSKLKYTTFINCSSSSVYGKKLYKMNEYDSLNPETFYAATKAAGEMLSKGWSNQSNVINIRPFSVYGVGEAAHRFIPTIIRSLENGTTLPLDPDPVHDWIYVDDFIEGIFTIYKNADKLSGQAINIGTGKQYTNLQVVQLLEEISGKRLSLDPYKRPVDSPVWCADITKIKGLGWKPKISLKEGLELCLKKES